MDFLSNAKARILDKMLDLQFNEGAEKKEVDFLDNSRLKLEKLQHILDLLKQNLGKYLTSILSLSQTQMLLSNDLMQFYYADEDQASEDSIKPTRSAILEDYMKISFSADELANALQQKLNSEALVFLDNWSFLAKKYQRSVHELTVMYKEYWKCSVRLQRESDAKKNAEEIEKLENECKFLNKRYLKMKKEIIGAIEQFLQDRFLLFDHFFLRFIRLQSQFWALLADEIVHPMETVQDTFKESVLADRVLPKYFKSSSRRASGNLEVHSEEDEVSEKPVNPENSAKIKKKTRKSPKNRSKKSSRKPSETNDTEKEVEKSAAKPVEQLAPAVDLDTDLLGFHSKENSGDEEQSAPVETNVTSDFLGGYDNFDIFSGGDVMGNEGHSEAVDIDIHVSADVHEDPLNSLFNAGEDNAYMLDGFLGEMGTENSATKMGRKETKKSESHKVSRSSPPKNVKTKKKKRRDKLAKKPATHRSESPSPMRGVHAGASEIRAAAKEELQSSIAESQKVLIENYRNKMSEEEKHQEDKREVKLRLESTLDRWEYKNGVRKNLRTLLGGLPSLLGDWENVSLKGCDLVSLTSSSGVKKAYRSAVLVVHPDKVKNSSVEKQVVAERVFNALTEQWDVFRSS